MNDAAQWKALRRQWLLAERWVSENSKMPFVYAPFGEDSGVLEAV